MKSFMNFVVLAVIGCIVYLSIIGENEMQTSDDDVSQAKMNLTTYGEIGTANDWPVLDETPEQLSDNLVAANYYLVVDGSGSMADSGCSNGEQKLAVAKSALMAFVAKISDQANIGVFAFDRQGIGERLALAKNSADSVSRVLNSITASGGTPLSVAIEAGNRALTEQARKQLGYGEYHLVVVTDGEANAGYQPDWAVRSLLEKTPIVLHTVGFCIDSRHSLNQPGYTLYKAANDPESLAAGLDAVLAEAPDFSVSDFAGEG